MRIDHSLRPDALGAAAFGPEPGCGCIAPDCDAGQLTDELDERTVIYVLETRSHFEDLRQALSQIAGMLVLATVGAKSVTQDHAMFAAALEAHRRASDGIRAARPTTRAQHHHEHLLEAADSLGLAIAKAGEGLHLAGDRQRMEGMSAPLQAAYRSLNWAGQALPGFEILNFDQACCAPQA
jgi:hypothetical protein